LGDSLAIQRDGSPARNRPRHASDARDMSAQPAQAGPHEPLGGAPKRGHWMLPDGSQQTEQSKCSDRSQRERQAQPSFELFQFKSIGFFMTAKPARG
jgi:hypothetical protein